MSYLIAARLRTMSRLRPWFALSLAVTLALLALLAVPVTSANGGSEVQLRDDCDPATFNAALGSGACVGDGDVTFDALIQSLIQRGSHPEWRFAPTALTIRPGESLRVRNKGGETHSFTEVASFGGGIIQALNDLLGLPTVTSTQEILATLMAPGARRQLSGLSVGTHLFQCMIHPWMHATVTVSAH